MNRALLKRSLGEAGWLAIGCALVLFAFHWIYVWMVTLIDLGWLGSFIQMGLKLPMQGLFPLPAEEIATPLGMVALSYVDPVPLLTLTVWAIARGSDAVSGPLDRGTLELVLAQPVSRLSVLGAHMLVTTLGSLMLAASCWFGTVAGLYFVDLGVAASYSRFLPAALNLFAFTVFLAALTTLASACDRYRFRTIGLVGAIYIVQLIMKVVARMGQLDWLTYCTFFGAFEPAVLARESEDVLRLSLIYNGAYLGAAIVCYVAAAVVFQKRDLPAPL